MEPKLNTPIYSARNDDDDGELRDEISRFVVRLAERVDLLQDMEGGSDLVALRALASGRASEAGHYGFAILAEAALELGAACEDAKPDAARDGMVELTDIARRIRLGHRGAA